MTDLPTRLLAAIEQRERYAHEATPGPWTAYDRGVCWEIPELPDVHDGTGFTRPDVHHIVANDPSTVLRQCAAHKRIVAEIQSWKHHFIEEDPWYSCPLAVDPKEPDRPGSGCSRFEDDNIPTAELWCDCGLESSQRAILTPLAEGYGINLEGR